MWPAWNIRQDWWSLTDGARSGLRHISDHPRETQPRLTDETAKVTQFGLPNFAWAGRVGTDRKISLACDGEIAQGTETTGMFSSLVPRDVFTGKACVLDAISLFLTVRSQPDVSPADLPRRSPAITEAAPAIPHRKVGAAFVPPGVPTIRVPLSAARRWPSQSGRAHRPRTRRSP